MLLDETGRRKELEFGGGCALLPVFRIAFAFEDRRTRGEKLWKNRDLKNGRLKGGTRKLPPTLLLPSNPLPTERKIEPTIFLLRRFSPENICFWIINNQHFTQEIPRKKLLKRSSLALYIFQFSDWKWFPRFFYLCTTLGFELISNES